MSHPDFFDSEATFVLHDWFKTSEVTYIYTGTYPYNTDMYVYTHKCAYYFLTKIIMSPWPDIKDYAGNYLERENSGTASRLYLLPILCINPLWL